MAKLPKFLQIDENDSEEEKKKKKFLLILFPIISILIVVGIVLAIIFGLNGCKYSPTHQHLWDTPTYTWASDYSNCTAERVCTEDASHKETETVNSVYRVLTDAQCEVDGEGQYTVTFTNEAFESQSKTVVLEAIGHNWGDPTYVWSEDYSSCTATAVCLNDATHIETETVNSTYEVVTEATMEKEGKGVYTAIFTNETFEEQTNVVTLPKDTYATKPYLSSDGKTVTYGIYPQTNVNDESLVSALNALTTPESNGWYLYNNDYYAKVSATPNNPIYVFDNGTTIESGTTYWFKCEPITWNVLSNNAGQYYILSSVLLDVHCYYNSTSERTIGGNTVYANNYEYSDIRTWLNNDFYNLVFALGNKNILTTTVDNSASTTNSSSNKYACNNTQDKVFLPSYQDYINSSYDFSTSAGETDTRRCRTTDWARARGARSYTSNGYGYYWTRSPYSTYPTYPWNVIDNGYLSNNRVDSTFVSVRPAISITIA